MTAERKQAFAAACVVALCSRALAHGQEALRAAADGHFQAAAAAMDGISRAVKDRPPRVGDAVPSPQFLGQVREYCRLADEATRWSDMLERGAFKRAPSDKPGLTRAQALDGHRRAKERLAEFEAGTDQATLERIKDYRFRKMPIRLPGRRLPDRTAEPAFDSGALEVLAELELPAGHVAVSKTGRVFLTPFYYDGESPGQVAELKGGGLELLPAARYLADFKATHSVRMDGQDRLWVLDHGNFGLNRPRLAAFDIGSGQRVHEARFPSEIAGLGSMLNDLAVDEERGKVYISDTGPIARRPAIVVYDIATGEASRALDGHYSVSPSHYPHVYKDGGKERVWRSPGGLMEIKGGLDGIVLDKRHGVLYYAAANRGELYRINVEDLIAPNLSPQERAARVERFANITASDGMAMDSRGNIYLTNQENHSIVRVGPDGGLTTLVRGPAVSWPVSVDVGPDDSIYFTCYPIPEVTMRSPEAIRRKGPYFVFRLPAGPL